MRVNDSVFQASAKRAAGDAVLFGAIAFAMAAWWIFDSWSHRLVWSFAMGLAGGLLTVWRGPTLWERAQRLVGKLRR